MPKNPYLAHYFGTALDYSDNEGEIGVNANKNFSYFPTAKHMTQHVFHPLRGVVPVNESCPAVCTPPSGVTADLSHMARASGDRSLSCPPSSSCPPSVANEWKNRLPSLLPQESRFSTSLEMCTKQLGPLHNGVSPSDADSSGNCRSQEPLRHSSVVTVDKEPSSWDSMIRQSHAAIFRVKELLDYDKEIPAATNSCPTNVLDAPQLDAEQNERETRQVENEKVGDFPLTPLSSCISVSTVDRQDCAATNQQPSVKSALVETTPQGSVDVLSLENKEGNGAASPMQTSRPLFDLVKPHSVDGVGNLQRPTLSDPLKAKCLVLTLNSDAPACAAKRLSRRPPKTVLTPSLCTGGQYEASAARPSIISPAASAEMPTSSLRDGKRRSRHKKRGSREGVISVNSLYGILERLADVVHPRLVGGGTQVDSESRKAVSDACDGALYCRDFLSENCRVTDIDGRGNTLKQTVQAPKVLMGNAPRLEKKETAVGDRCEALNSTFPTSQLPSVGVGQHHTSLIQQRTSSARRRSLSRLQKTPRYALPTESWLYKGAELDEADVDTSCILGDVTTKGLSR